MQVCLQTGQQLWRCIVFATEIQLYFKELWREGLEKNGIRVDIGSSGISGNISQSFDIGNRKLHDEKKRANSNKEENPMAKRRGRVSESQHPQSASVLLSVISCTHHD
jgi:hypothetical protein